MYVQPSDNCWGRERKLKWRNIPPQSQEVFVKLKNGTLCSPIAFIPG
jgi:hypothetical protein